MELDVDEGGLAPGLLGTVLHTFGGSYDPVHQRVSWWVDGVRKIWAYDRVVGHRGCIRVQLHPQGQLPYCPYSQLTKK
jgi:hypothetical protein